MADYVVRNLKYTLKSAVNKLSAAERRSVSDSLGFSTKENAKSDVHAYDSPATRALLVVASASLFHARMADSMREMKPDVDDRTQKTFSGSWPPQSLEFMINRLEKNFRKNIGITYVEVKAQHG